MDSELRPDSGFQMQTTTRVERLRMTLPLLAGFFLSFALRVSITPYLKELVDFFGVDYTAVGGLTSAFLLGYALLRFPAGLAADRIPPRRLLTIGYILAGCSWIVFLLAGRDLTLAIVAIFFSGVGAAMLYSPAVKLLTLMYGENERGLVFGAIQMAIGLGSVFSLGVMPALVGVDHWRLGFGIYPLMALGFVISVQKVPNVPEVSAGHSPVALKTPNQLDRGVLRQVFLLFVLAFFTFFGPFGATSWFPTFLREARDLPIRQASLIASLVSVMHTSTGPFAGKISDWLGSRVKVFTAGSLVMLAGYGMIAFSHTLPLIVIAALLMGIGMGSMITSLLLYAVESLGLERAGFASGLLGTFGQLASALSVTVIGSVLTRGLPFEVIWALAGGSAGIAILTLLLSNRLLSTAFKPG